MTLPMKLQHWVDVNKLNFDYLSINPNAIYLLKKNPDKIDWDGCLEIQTQSNY